MTRFGSLLPVLALSGCAVLALATKKRSFPDQTGEMTVVGIEGKVRVERDAVGVPHIFASTPRDAWFGLGFVHGQDRLFQADLNRRVAFGGLSAWFGESTVELDAFMQGLGLRSLAYDTVRKMDPERRAQLEAYSAGINAGAASLGADPIEYRLLGLEWEPWAPTDSYGLPYLMSWSLSENLSIELFALSMRKDADRDRMDALLRSDDREPMVDLFWSDLRGVDLGDWTPQFAAFNAGLGSADAAASNNWVVSGSRTADGKPLLANDPHLSQSVPSLWYAAEVHGGDLHASGMTFPGAPGVLVGHNDHVSWGVTNVMADTVDLAVFERHGDEGYVHNGQNKAMTKRVVRVPMGDEVVERTIYWTDVGPVITELDASHVVALQWASLHIDDNTYSLFGDIMDASSVDEAVAATEHDSIIAQNFVFADDAGHIGWSVGGSLVRRRGLTGRVPYPAWQDELGWQGWIDRKPREIDPERGYIVTANSRPDSPGVDAISTGWVAPWRHDRIASELQASSKHTVTSTAALQFDVVDEHARTRIPQLLDGVTPGTEAAKTCHALLIEWDGESRAGDVGPSVWAVFQREMLRHALTDELGEAGVQRYLAAVRPGRTVLDGKLDAVLQDREQTTVAALDSTCSWLADHFGAEPSNWTWGQLHPLSLQHPFGQKLPGWNMPTVPFGGSSNTVAAGSFALGEDMSTRSMASMRMVVPMSDVGATTFSNPGGQSGHPGHRDYDTLFDEHIAGQHLPLNYGEEASALLARQTLVLVPGADD